MKLVLVLLLASGIQVTAGPSAAQDVTISGKNISLEKIFREIRKQTGYQFFYKNELLQSAAPVDIRVQHAPVKEVLDLCFKNQPLTYAMLGETIVVKAGRQKTVVPSGMQPAIPVMQDIVVTGLVTDSSGTPLPGATVYVKNNKTIGTATDQNGRYSLKTPDDAVLVFNMVGFESQEIPVHGRPIINIRLRPSLNRLDETVVVAFGKQKRKKWWAR